MDAIIVKVIIRSSLDIIGGRALNPFHEKIEEMVFDSKILMKDLCRKIMEKIGLEDMVDQSQAFIQHSNMEYYPLNSLCPNINTEIGSVSILFNQKLTVEILIPLRFEDIIKLQEIDVMYRNLFQYLLLKVPEIGDHIPDAVDKYFKDEEKVNPSMRDLPLKTLLQMNGELINAIKLHTESMTRSLTVTSNGSDNSNLPPTLRMSSISCQTDVRHHDVVGSGIDNNVGELQVFNDDNSTPSVPQENHEEVSLDNRANNYRLIRYNKDTEVPILEQWYKSLNGKTPTDSDFQKYANALNVLSKRCDPNRLTSDNIFGWYKRRKYKRGIRVNEKRRVSERIQVEKRKRYV
uniref:Homeobox domain-containing protein n=1 Tax=Strongyloides venezuelensis TaxID=75913 RepID=A0A0K0EZF1_STRVS